MSMFEENSIYYNLKKAIIVPIHKGNDKLSLSSYRLISLTSTLMKSIIRKVVAFLESNVF